MCLLLLETLPEIIPDKKRKTPAIAAWKIAAEWIGLKSCNNLDDFTSKDLGSADLVEERKVETDKWVFIEGCRNPKAVTILVRGGSQRVVDEADRSIHDALMVVKDVLENPENYSI